MGFVPFLMWNWPPNENRSLISTKLSVVFLQVLRILETQSGQARGFLELNDAEAWGPRASADQGPKPGCSSRFRGIFILPGLITPIHTAVKWLLSVISCWILICRYHNPPNKDYTLYKVGFPKAVPQTRCNHTLNVRILIGDSWNLKLVFFVDWWTCSTCRNCSDWGSAC